MKLSFRVLTSPSQVAPFKKAIEKHIMELPPEDRSFRFFGSSLAGVDFWLTKITTSSDSKHIIVLILDEDEVVAVGDIAYSNPKNVAELALSVSPDVRELLVTTTDIPNELESKQDGTKINKWLLGTLVDIAKGDKFNGVSYSTMPENQKMLTLGKNMGFSHKWIDGAVKGEKTFQGDEL